MATQDIANAQNALKEAILPKLVDMTEQSHFLQDIVTKNSTDFDYDGRDFYGYIHVIEAGSLGVNSIAEAGSLPTPGRVSYDRMYVVMRYHYGAIQVTGPAITLGKGKYALTDVLQMEMTQIAKNLKKHQARTWVSDGTGALARVASRSTTTLTLYRNNLSPGAFLIEPGMVLDSYDAKASGAIGYNAVTVSAVDRVNNTITLSADPGSDQDGDYLFVAGSYGYLGMGLLGICDDGATFQSTFQGKTRSVDTWLKANVLSNPAGAGTVRDLTVDVLQQAIDACEDNTADPSADGPTYIYGNKLLRREYFALSDPDRRFPATPGTLNRGWKYLEFTGGTSTVRWVADNWVVGGRLFLFQPKDLVLFEGAKPHWLNARFGGDPLVFAPGSGDLYRGDLGWYTNLGALKCRTMARVDDLRTS